MPVRTKKKKCKWGKKIKAPSMRVHALGQFVISSTAPEKKKGEVAQARDNTRPKKAKSTLLDILAKDVETKKERERGREKDRRPVIITTFRGKKKSNRPPRGLDTNRGEKKELERRHFFATPVL